MKQYWSKLITRVHDIIKDYKAPHYPDLVMHSKALIAMLTSLTLKKKRASFEFRNDRKTSYEEKLEYLLDNQLISEEVYDNCINTLALRNPIEHIYTYPNEFFGKGAAQSALSMYMSLQPSVDLPHIPKAEALIEELKIGVPFVLSCTLDKFEPTFSQAKEILKKYPGSYIVLMDFPNSLFKGQPMPGLKLDEKVQYSLLLLEELKALEGVGKAEFAGMEIFPMHPHNKEYFDERYPGFKK